MGTRRLLVYLLVASAVVVAAVQGILGNLVSDQLPTVLKPYAPQLFIGITVAAIIIAELLYRGQEATKTFQYRLRRRDRQRFLFRLQGRYARRRDDSFRGFKRLTLSLQEQPTAVKGSASIYQEVRGERPIRTWNSAQVEDVFDVSERALLILGAPGAGKTVLLLDLALALIKTAQQDATVAMPVFFSLASWSARQQPLDEWMVEELSATYQVPRDLAVSWVMSDELMPVLDGLDEVDRAHRGSCIETISAYHLAHGLVPIVVCSRATDYLSLDGSRLALGTAVTLESPSGAQVDDYLEDLGEQFTGMLAATRRDASLRDLLTNPLLLNIALLTYQDQQPDAIPPLGDRDAWQQQLFQHYIDKRLTEPSAEVAHYDPQHVVAWLGWLAQQMTEHGVADLYLERLQPDWLPSRSKRIWFQIGSIVILGATIGVVNVLGVWNSMKPQYALLFGALSALVVTPLLMRFGRTTIRFNAATIWSWPSAMQGTTAGFIVGLGFGLSVGISTGLGASLVVTAISLAVTQGLIILLSWFMFDTSLRSVLAILATFNLITGELQLFLLQQPAVLYIGLGAGLIPGVAYALIVAFTQAVLFGFFYGIIESELDTHDLTMPGEGIARSAKNSVVVSLLFFGWWSLIFVVLRPIISLVAQPLIVGNTALALFTIRFLVNYPLVWLPVSMSQFLPYIVAVAVYVGLLRGGLSVIQYAILRWQLRRAAVIPRHLPRFLQYVADRALLQSNGGGYHFIHPLFQAFFAEHALALRTADVTVTSTSRTAPGAPSSAYWANKASQLVDLERFDEAVVAAEHALEIDPKNAYVWHLKGYALSELRKMEQALDASDHACALSPKVQIYLVSKAYILNELGRYEEALLVCDQALALDSAAPHVLATKGVSLSALQRSAEALNAFSQALALDTDAAWVWRNVAGELIETFGRFNEALSAAERATQLEPQSIRGWLLTGDALQGLGRDADASAAYARALELPAQNSFSHLQRGEALMSTGQWAEALEAFEQAAALVPYRGANAGDAYRGSALALAVLGRHTEALANFDRAEAITPHSADTLYVITACLRACGRTEDAAEAQRKATLQGQPSTSTRMILAQIELHGSDVPALTTLKTVDAVDAVDSADAAEASGLAGQAPASPSPFQFPATLAEVQSQLDRRALRTKRMLSHPLLVFVRLVTLIVTLVVVLTGGTYLYLRSFGAGGITIASIYSNPLNGGASSGWPNDSICFFGADGYHITGSYACYAPTGNIGDAVTSVSVKQIAGPNDTAYGLAIRRTPNNESYQFLIDSNGEWVFVKVVNDTSSRIVDFTANAAIKKGLNQVNVLSVHATGNHFSFFVNSVQVGSAVDNDFSSGGIGLVGATGATVVFTNLTAANVIT